MEQSSRKRRKLTDEDGLKIIEEWNYKTVEELASELGVAPNTVRSMVYEIRKENSSLCPRRSKRTRADVARGAIELWRMKMENEDTDTLTDMDK